MLSEYISFIDRVWKCRSLLFLLRYIICNLLVVEIIILLDVISIPQNRKIVVILLYTCVFLQAYKGMSI